MAKARNMVGSLIVIVMEKLTDGEQIKKTWSVITISLDFSHTFYFKKIALLRCGEWLLGRD